MNHKPQILIIDDVPDNIEVLGEAIASLGDVSFALSGEEGLQHIQEQRPDLILLDVMMPGMNGYEVFAKLKTSQETAHIPVIFVTAKSDPLNESAALNAGAIDFISKPINPTVAKARVCLHLTHLERSREVLQLNAELEQRVLERTQALSDALVKAREAQETKSRLLANMSHEVRSPLNAVLGMAYLASRKVSDPKVVEMLGKISESGNRLLGLLTGILDIARIEAHQLRIQNIPFGLETVMQASVALLRRRAHAKGLEVDISIDPAVPGKLIGDPVRIGNVLTNFLSNAIKFSSHGNIWLRMTAENQVGDAFSLRMEVQDQGVGIKPDDQARIFELFEQMDPTSTRQYGGMGIGLTICKLLVSMMGGEVGVSSEVGKGSTFWAIVPLKRYVSNLQGTDGLTAERTSRLMDYLCVLLADDDFNAIALWEAERATIESSLGQYAKPFAQAMEAFDLDEALKQVRALTK